MELKISNDIIRNSISVYGEENQTTVCMEELAELIQAISKEKRGLHDKIHLAEEIADVEICLEMLKIIYEIDENTIESQIRSKQKRQARRNKHRLKES